MLHTSKLSFEIISSGNCNLIFFADTSYYNPSQTVANLVLQIISPFAPAPVEVNFYAGGVTIINSNLLGITDSWDDSGLQILPDGIYTGKISMCPEDQFYFENTWFRTCQL